LQWSTVEFREFVVKSSINNVFCQINIQLQNDIGILLRLYQDLSTVEFREFVVKSSINNVFCQINIQMI
jgi:hypothetical protein